MFTGIITHIGTIISAEKRGDLRLSIACDFGDEPLTIGESIACNGACLTVVEQVKNQFSVDLSAETLSRTAQGQWETGRKINLERSLKLGDRLDGHMVSGHVDGIAIIKEIIPSGGSTIVGLEVLAALAKFIAEKGSVTLAGVSLTVNKVEGARFWVNIISHTWQVTNLNACKTGDGLNLEIDVIARYVARLLEQK